MNFESQNRKNSVVYKIMKLMQNFSKYDDHGVQNILNLGINNKFWSSNNTKIDIFCITQLRSSGYSASRK